MKTLREIIKEKGVTNRIVAEGLGISETNIKRYDDLSKRNLEDLEKIAKAIGISLTELLNMAFSDSEFIIIDEPELNLHPVAISSVSNKTSLPYYDVDITLGFDNLLEDQTTVPTYYLNVPAFKNCDCAVPVYGRSMTPDINDGAIIAIKEVSLENVLPGEAYMIITDEYRTVKYIRTCKDDPNKLRLVPKTLDEFDEMVIDKRQIRRVFLVKGVITNKIL